ncbi:MAG: Uma2 family endonuclease [Scytonema sp. PMC 1069.18]|nr:Uma2 family endonuclease [Scytonema sp. PMC 1069.18]MEC4883149.1 Uma2 family endonuclease [Scytonema sp. PMC 1070.18]
MLNYKSFHHLPSAEELPSSDDTPVDNELQNLIPNLLLATLAMIWAERMDWFFGVDMGIFYIPNQRSPKPLVPDGFLSIGVERRKGQRGRLSYVLWEENYVVPLLALECVSQNYGGEYDDKQQKYAQLGILYYVIYNPEFWKRDKHKPFEVYRLVDGEYVRQQEEPFWIPEIGLGIGRGQGMYGGWTREWLYWYAENGAKFPSPDEATMEQQLRANEAEKRAKQAEQQLAEMDVLLKQYQERFGDLQ